MKEIVFLRFEMVVFFIFFSFSFMFPIKSNGFPKFVICFWDDKASNSSDTSSLEFTIKTSHSTSIVIRDGCY